MRKTFFFQWQSSATAVRELCRQSGKVLPPEWENFAIAVALHCYGSGRTLLL
ncbi:MAG: hypothetical protein IJ901_10345 [Bacteroidaceae bacterium]|nr:hypothetical protein [Bacteroidaceae bacterium]